MAKEKTKAELEAELAALYETLEEKNKKIKKLEGLLSKKGPVTPVQASKTVQH